MFRLKHYIFPFFLIAFHHCLAQTNPVLDSLSVLNERIRVAKELPDNKIVLETYFGNSFAAISSWTYKSEDFKKITQFLQQGIDFARSINEYDHVAIGHTQKAAVLRKIKDVENAFKSATTVLLDFAHLRSDSVKTIVLIEIGDCYQAKSESVEASKYYNKAFDIALENRNHFLESKINNSLAQLYNNQRDTAEAKRYIYKNIHLHTKNKNGEGLIAAYTQLGRFTDNIAYIDTVFSVAEKFRLENKTLGAKTILLAIYGFVKKDIPKALRYMNSEPDLKNSMMTGPGGAANYYFYIAQLYHYNDHPDSALYYVKLAEPDFAKDSLVNKLKEISVFMAQCYQSLGDRQNAINYYKKSLDYSKLLADLPAIVTISNALSRLYEQTENFKLAYTYKLLTTDVKDSMAKLAREKDMFFAASYRETKKLEDELEQQQERIKKKHNLQYMGITIGICIVFLAFLVLGMFPVSKLVIKIFGFVYFICLFEFIILLIDHSILHPITHGDPLKLWGLKIILLILLVPFQQLLEHKLIHYLQSRKLLHARTRLMNKKWWKRNKPVLKAELIEETDREA